MANVASGGGLDVYLKKRRKRFSGLVKAIGGLLEGPFLVASALQV